MSTTKIIKGTFELKITSDVELIPSEILKYDIEKAFRYFGFGQNSQVTIVSQEIVGQEQTKKEKVRKAV